MSLFPRKNKRNQDGSRKHSQPEIKQDVQEQNRGARRQQTATLNARYLLDLQKQMGREALSRLLKSPLASLLNSLMIAVAFTLPALLYLLVVNLQILSGNWDGQPRLSVYLDDSANEQRVDTLMKDIRSEQTLLDVVYISPDQGLQDFQQKSGVGNIASELGFNPLPGVIVLTPPVDASYQQLEALVESLEQKSGVEKVQVDRQWVQRLNAILGLLERSVTTLGILLGLTALLVISNTIRLNIESRRDEIRIIKMVGGTDGFITLPFLYMGAWYGLAGALLSQIIILCVMAAVSSQIMNLAGLYNSGLSLQSAGFGMFGTLLSTGIFLGIVGASVSCHRHLKTLMPQ